MKQVSFHEEADAEMMEAAQYYEKRAFGLGASFLDAVEETIDKLSADPEAYQVVGSQIRQKLLQRFPFSILYAVEDNRIRIVAVAHHKRRPGYWRSRL